jgi:hypothetical protein
MCKMEHLYYRECEVLERAMGVDRWGIPKIYLLRVKGQ